VVAIAEAALVLTTSLRLMSLFVSAQGPLDADPNARRLAVFDREGRVVSTVSERGLYSQPAFSADRTRLAVVKTAASL
jgi:hypothetical protein